LTQKGLPTYELPYNYGDLDHIKQFESQQAVNPKGDVYEIWKMANDTDDFSGFPAGKTTEPTLTELQKRVNEYKNEIQRLKEELKQMQHHHTDSNDTAIDDIQDTSYLEQNPYKKLGLYSTLPKEYYNIGPKSTLHNNVRFYGIVHNPHYCEQVDLYNLVHQNHIFDQMNYITDYAADGILSQVIRLILILAF